jgi:hypothetical protein
MMIVLFSMLMAQVSAHARLMMPDPWNPNPSKSFPCGGVSTYPASAQVVNLTIGSTVKHSYLQVAI